MISYNDAQKIAFTLLDSTEGMSPEDRIETIEHEVGLFIERAKADFVTQITWRRGDIEGLRPDYTEDQLTEAMSYVAKGLHDRSVEEGQQILRDLLSMFDDTISSDSE